ncbi:MAG: DNA mismatch repair endonuclease MutL [Deltaproteobacteria bacterium]|nr:DNA mismatch repair endonuclease MutL [Deltaproteobacteria bacterium]
MNRIRLLPDSIASKIAAGEVVTSPASVVKELVENSIDAGATEITVHVNEGGKRLIKVVDNGVGIAREDCPLSFGRHATSKIAAEEDLFSIKTMGFRGEALFSIASVARVTLVSRVKEEVSGVKVTVEGGGKPVVEDSGAPCGTAVEVKDLFYNTPARLKFLKSVPVEAARVADTVKKTALAFPGITFRLFHGSSKVMETRKGNLKERIADIFGGEILKELVSVNSTGFSDEGVMVKGFTGRCGFTYATSKGLFTYVNSRPVYDRGINRAIIGAYSGMLEPSRYPFSVIDITLPPEEVDVNVHPSKSEVRFGNPSFVFEIVKGGIKDALRNEGAFMDKGPGPHYISTEAVKDIQGGVTGVREAVMPFSLPRFKGLEPPEKEEILSPAFSGLTVVGQLWAEFLIVEGEDGFLLIDQHAAAERVRFERLKSRCHEPGEAASQYLMTPERLDLTPQEADALHGFMPYLEKIGFEIVPFGKSSKSGGETFLVKAVPDILSGRWNAGVIKDVLEEKSFFGGSGAIEKNIDSVLMTIACHSVVRGPRPLTKEEALSLLRDMAEVDFSGHCPHGRPVVRRFARAEVEAMFKRR